MYRLDTSDFLISDVNSFISVGLVGGSVVMLLACLLLFVYIAWYIHLEFKMEFSGLLVKFRYVERA